MLFSALLDSGSDKNARKRKEEMLYIDGSGETSTRSIAGPLKRCILESCFILM